MSRRHPPQVEQVVTSSKPVHVHRPQPPLHVVQPALRLDTLVTELLFDILEHMELQDALRLRLACRRFADVILNAPSILKRSLRHIKAPLPYSPKPIHTLTGPEVISLCRRAFALEANWKRKLDRVRAHSFSPLHRPYEVALAPGGRYLITAYHSTSGEEHFINLYDLENNHGMVALASCPTETPISYLAATWMENKGRQGIAITWIRDLTRSDDHKPNVEVSVLFIPLRRIEMLADPKSKESEIPFEFLCRRQWNTSCCRVSTEDGVLSVARSPNTLSFYNLETGQKSMMTLPPLPGSLMPDPIIFAIRRLCDGTVLVVRGENGRSPIINTHAMEAYDLPKWGETVELPFPVQANFVHSNQTNYQISSMYRRQATSDEPTEEERKAAFNYFPTVCISVEATTPAKGITQYRLFPSYDVMPAPLEPRFVYEWPLSVWQGHYSEHDKDHTQTRSLPGADRSLGFPYTYPGRAWTPALSEFMVLDSYTDSVIPSVGLPDPIERDIVQCVAWDETSGKICLSTAQDLKMWILDFAV